MTWGPFQESLFRSNSNSSRWQFNLVWLDCRVLHCFKILNPTWQHCCCAMCEVQYPTFHYKLDDSRMKFPLNLNCDGKITCVISPSILSKMIFNILSTKPQTESGWARVHSNNYHRVLGLTAMGKWVLSRKLGSWIKVYKVRKFENWALGPNSFCKIGSCLKNWGINGNFCVDNAVCGEPLIILIQMVLTGAICSASLSQVVIYYLLSRSTCQRGWLSRGGLMVSMALVQIYWCVLLLIEAPSKWLPFCGCLVTWFCYQLIAKPGNKTATVLWPDPNALSWIKMHHNKYYLVIL